MLLPIFGHNILIYFRGGQFLSFFSSFLIKKQHSVGFKNGQISEANKAMLNFQNATVLAAENHHIL